jgi:hypothetical protein
MDDDKIAKLGAAICDMVDSLVLTTADALEMHGDEPMTPRESALVRAISFAVSGAMAASALADAGKLEDVQADMVGWLKKRTELQ